MAKQKIHQLAIEKQREINRKHREEQANIKVEKEVIQTLSDEELISEWLESNEIKVAPDPVDYHYCKMFISGDRLDGVLI